MCSLSASRSNALAPNALDTSMEPGVSYLFLFLVTSGEARPAAGRQGHPGPSPGRGGRANGGCHPEHPAAFLLRPWAPRLGSERRGHGAARGVDAAGGAWRAWYGRLPQRPPRSRQEHDLEVNVLSIAQVDEWRQRRRWRRQCCWWSCCW